MHNFSHLELQVKTNKMPTITEILNSHLSNNTHASYASYIKGYKRFLEANPLSDNPEHTVLVDHVVSFLHHEAERGQKARSVDQAKSALVHLFENMANNPAKDKKAKKYVSGLKKYRRSNNIDEELQSHPITTFELNELMSSLNSQHPFIKTYYQFLFSLTFIGCFRINEVLDFKWNDVELRRDSDNQPYLAVRLRWFKHANVNNGSRVYHLYNEPGVSCLNVVDFYNIYRQHLQSLRTNLRRNDYLFSCYRFETDGNVDVHHSAKGIQAKIKQIIDDVTESNANIARGVSLHSFRRGGAYFRVFLSPTRRFDFNQLMAWCRWSDAKTMATYLITENISNNIDPTNLLKTAEQMHRQPQPQFNPNEIAESVARILREHDNPNTQTKVVPGQSIAPPINTKTVTKTTVLQPSLQPRQTNLNSFAATTTSRVVPKPPKSVDDLWDYWFNVNPAVGIFTPMKEWGTCTNRRDQKKYSNWNVIGKVMEQYTDLNSFKAAYVGFTMPFTKLLKEIVRRNNLNS
eukprot:NODE_220_length_12432_cov_0.484878.p2 type:complete len:518 gc:universal NODE_220_length_12432_cov_0.484878:7970-6417(-)